MPIDAPILFAFIINPDGSVFRKWDLRYPTIVLSADPFPSNFRETYEASLPVKRMDDPVALKNDLPVLMIMSDDGPIGAVNIHYRSLTEKSPIQIINITSTGKLRRTSELVLGAALQFVEAYPFLRQWLAILRNDVHIVVVGSNSRTTRHPSTDWCA